MYFVFLVSLPAREVAIIYMSLQDSRTRELTIQLHTHLPLQEGAPGTQLPQPAREVP